VDHLEQVTEDLVITRRAGRPNPRITAKKGRGRFDIAIGIATLGI
jgi:hypothetical protein